MFLFFDQVKKLEIQVINVWNWYYFCMCWNCELNIALASMCITHPQLGMLVCQMFFLLCVFMTRLILTSELPWWPDVFSLVCLHDLAHSNIRTTLVTRCFFLSCVCMAWLILTSELPWWPDVFSLVHLHGLAHSNVRTALVTRCFFLSCVCMAWLILTSEPPWWPDVFFSRASAWPGSF
jgi:hypothetical protein